MQQHYMNNVKNQQFIFLFKKKKKKASIHIDEVVWKRKCLIKNHFPFDFRGAAASIFVIKRKSINYMEKLHENIEQKLFV